MSEKLEITVLANLIRNDEFMRKVIPFIQKGYFKDDAKLVFEKAADYVAKYNALPSHNALRIEVVDGGISTELVDEIFMLDVDGDQEWLLDKTEKWCQDRALEIAIARSYNIMLDKDKKLDRGSIPELLQTALGVTFDTSIGHDYFGDAKERFASLTEKIEKIPFDVEVFNDITKGGFEPGTLNVLMASCVSPTTRVKFKLNDETPFVGIISETPTFLQNGFSVKVDSPAGFVDVIDYKVIGQFEEYIITTENGAVLSCNKDHMVMTTLGWQTAETIEMLNRPVHVNTITGYSRATVTKTDRMIPIVDIEIDHPSHSYWSDGIESHNTGVGKSLVMSHMAAANLAMGYDVLYVTLEMAEKKIGNRIDANLMGIELNDFVEHEAENLLNRLQNIQKKTSGQLIIKQYAPGTANVNHLRALFKDLFLKKKFKPKIVFLDYLNLAASARVRYGASTYEYVKAVAEEVRGLAIEFNVPIVSATQTNRAGYDNSDITLSETSESTGLPATADFFLAIMQTEEMAKQGQYLCKQLKNRYDDKDRKLRFAIGVDKPTMRVFELDSAQGVLQAQEKAFLSENDQRTFDEFKV